MVSEATTRHLISKFGFDHYDFVNPVNHCGGLWVLWNNNEIIANVLLKEQRLIHMLVFDTHTQQMVTYPVFMVP